MNANNASHEIAGPLQTEILCLMWEPRYANKKWTVNDLHVMLNVKRENRNEHKLAYTTVLTVLRNLARREFINQEANGRRAHDFTTKISRAEYEHTVLLTICTSLFGGITDRLEAAVQDFRQYDEKHKAPTNA